MPLACFDLETTHKDPNQARIVSACVSFIDGSEVDSRTWLADPGVEIPEEAAGIHGITTEYARANGRPHEWVARQVGNALYEAWRGGRIVAVFNGAYDFTVMSRILPAFRVGPSVDGYVLDRKFDPYRKGSRKLVDTCARYGVKIGEAHTADADALAAARLAWKLPRVFPELALLTVDELMSNQALWYRQRQENFVEYLVGKGQDPSDVNLFWPVQPAPMTEAEVAEVLDAEIVEAS